MVVIDVAALLTASSAEIATLIWTTCPGASGLTLQTPATAGPPLQPSAGRGISCPIRVRIAVFA